MGRRRWLGLEERSADGYTDLVTAGLVARAEGKQPTAQGAAVVEAAAGLVGRCFQAAEVEGAGDWEPALTPSFLGDVGRQLVRAGEAIYLPRADNGAGQRLLAASAVDITGDPATWKYRLELSGPTESWSVEAAADRVLHFRRATDPIRPWAGVGPMSAASVTARLHGALERALGDEAAGPRGTLLAAPRSGASSKQALEGLEERLRTLGGRTALLKPFEHGGGGVVKGADSPQGWDPKRLGAAPPAGAVQLLDHAGKDLLAACGVPSGLLAGTQAATVRESWRVLFFSLIYPLGQAVEHELRSKLGLPSLDIRWDALAAADVASRARAFKALTEAGMEAAQAAGQAGLDG